MFKKIKFWIRELKRKSVKSRLDNIEEVVGLKKTENEHPVNFLGIFCQGFFKPTSLKERIENIEKDLELVKNTLKLEKRHIDSKDFYVIKKDNKKEK